MQTGTCTGTAIMGGRIGQNVHHVPEKLILVMYAGEILLGIILKCMNVIFCHYCVIFYYRFKIHVHFESTD